MIHIFFTPSHIFRTIHENHECWSNEQQLHWEGRQIRISTISRTLGTVFAASSPPLHCEATTAVVPQTGHGSHTKSATNTEVVTGLWTTCYKQACRGSREFTPLRSTNPEDDRNRSFTDGDNKTTNRFLVAAQVPQCRLNRWSQFFRKFVKFHAGFVKSRLVKIRTFYGNFGRVGRCALAPYLIWYHFHGTLFVKQLSPNLPFHKSQFHTITWLEQHSWMRVQNVLICLIIIASRLNR